MSVLRIMIGYTGVVACFALLLVACQGTLQEATRTYQVKGRIISIPADKKSVVIRHEDIPGFMSSMTMSFPVKDSNVLTNLAPNDLVNFELIVTPHESWISRLEKTGRVEGNEAAASEVSTSVEPILATGQEAPAFHLTDQDGQAVSLRDFRGKPVAITFIFTRCPLPDYCPRFTSHFAVVQEKLSPHHDGQFHLISITIDPEHDTPEVLKEFGQRFGADFQTWSWLTGSAKAIRDISAPYGVRYWSEDGTINHSAVCAVIDAAGRLYRIYRGNTWTPEEIISDLTKLLADSKNISKSLNPLEDNSC